MRGGRGGALDVPGAGRGTRALGRGRGVHDQGPGLQRGQSIIEEEDLESTRWFRVRLPREKARSQAEAGVAAGVEAGSGVRAEARATAWLPAVRTKNRPALPRCPHPAPASAPAPAP
ncbi:hypothetical protein OG468_36050 [Streptomyces zaomyceticus]|uniref:Uncharacterized protein n=1 Tax=Streptomyces zaomyceticus TaxID=68286 RepID=A0ABZ1L281_9ACTN